MPCGLAGVLTKMQTDQRIPISLLADILDRKQSFIKLLLKQMGINYVGETIPVEDALIITHREPVILARPSSLDSEIGKDIGHMQAVLCDSRVHGCLEH